jgi:hypothetical protein
MLGGGQPHIEQIRQVVAEEEGAFPPGNHIDSEEDGQARHRYRDQHREIKTQYGS